MFADKDASVNEEEGEESADEKEREEVTTEEDEVRRVNLMESEKSDRY